MRIYKIIQWGVLKCGRSGVGGLPQIKPNAYPYSSFPKCPMRGSIFGTSKPLGDLNSVQCVCDWWKCISKKLFWKLLQHIVSLTRSKWNDLSETENLSEPHQSVRALPPSPPQIFVLKGYIPSLLLVFRRWVLSAYYPFPIDESLKS